MTSKSVDALSFTVRPVDSMEDMIRVCELRADCYGRRDPVLREHMARPDEIDRSSHSTVFLAEDKATGLPIGTMRVLDNTKGARLEIEDFLDVPEWMAGSTRCEMTRLVVAAGADPLVKPALWKAGYLLCQSAGVQWLIVGARKPGLIKQYQYLGCRDMYPDQRMIPLGHGWMLPHRVFVMNIPSAPDDWYAGEHRLLRFMVETEHPDIALSSVHRAPAASAPRLSLVAPA